MSLAQSYDVIVIPASGGRLGLTAAAPDGTRDGFSWVNLRAQRQRPL
jgi:hypothetical protein